MSKHLINTIDILWTGCTVSATRLFVIKSLKPSAANKKTNFSGASPFVIYDPRSQVFSISAILVFPRHFQTENIVYEHLTAASIAENHKQWTLRTAFCAWRLRRYGMERYEYYFFGEKNEYMWLFMSFVCVDTIFNVFRTASQGLWSKPANGGIERASDSG